MNPRPRVLPVLLIDGARLVKTRRFAHPTYLGDPLNTLRIFNEKQADEMIVLDIASARRRRGPDLESIREWAGECFMPLCYGGGIDRPDQGEACLRCGVEKVAITSAAADGVIADLSRAVGRQSVVAGVDVAGGVPVIRRGRRRLAISLRDHVRRLEDAGAGELLLQSVDRDGSMAGYDLELVRTVAGWVTIPVIALGGAGSVADLRAVLHAGAAAAAAGSLFSFIGRHRAVLVTYPAPEVIASLRDPAHA